LQLNASPQTWAPCGQRLASLRCVLYSCAGSSDEKGGEIGMAAAVTVDVGAVIDRSRAFLRNRVALTIPAAISPAAVATPTV
jgi:hypothetical protein